MNLKEIDGKTINIRWVYDTTLDVCVSLDKDGEAICERQEFYIDETDEVDVFGIDEQNNRINIQFGDGSVATGVLTSLFVIE